MATAAQLHPQMPMFPALANQLANQENKGQADLATIQQADTFLSLLNICSQSDSTTVISVLAFQTLALEPPSKVAVL